MPKYQNASKFSMHCRFSSYLYLGKFKTGALLCPTDGVSLLDGSRQLIDLCVRPEYRKNKAAESEDTLERNITNSDISFMKVVRVMILPNDASINIYIMIVFPVL